MLYDTDKHITISDARRLISSQHASDRLGVFDVTNRPGFGYDYAVFSIDAEGIRFGEPLLTSKSASDPDATNKLGQRGAVREVFDRAELAKIIENARGYVVCHCGGPRKEARARAIATFPELYEAAVAAEEWLWAVNPAAWGPSLDAVHKRLRAALAAALPPEDDTP